jgi:hypothetical protein
MVRIPEADWSPLNEFVKSQHPLPHGIEAAVLNAEADGAARIIVFRSQDAVRVLIERITTYARSWEVPWAVPLNRVLPRLYRAINAR